MDTEEARFALLEAMRGQLASLEGRSSGLVDSLPLEQKRRIRALKAMQESCDEHVRVCREKKKQAEKEMRESCAPLWKSRKEIVCGEREPTVEELPEDSEEEEEVDASEGIQGEEKEEEKGIPDFWSVVLQSHEVLEEMVRERCEKKKQRVRSICLDPSFALVLERVSKTRPTIG